MTTDLKQAKQKVIYEIDKLELDLGASNSIIAFSCSTEDGFRRALNPSYKLNRKGNRKPMGFKILRKFMEDTYVSKAVPTLEADDVIGILMTTPSEYKRIIVSIDKDFYSVPGFFYRTCDDKPVVTEVTPQFANHFFACQTLAGDPVDGFGGVPGIGMKTAEKLLSGVDACDYWTTIVKAYEKKGLTKFDALLNARMARILHASDWDNTNKCIKLWEDSSHV